MTKESFEKDNWSWQLQKLQQQMSEWWELQLKKLNLDRLGVPNPSEKEWSALWQTLRPFLIILLILLVIWAAWQIWQQWRFYFKRLNSQFNQANESLKDRAEKQSSVEIWLKRSQNFQQQRNYYQACRCLYFAMLQQLHDSAIIPHQASRTDEEYRLLILQLPQPDAYETLLKIHQKLCFGYQTASANLLSECQQAYRQIERNSVNE